MSKINVLGEFNCITSDKIIARTSQIYDDNSKSFVNDIILNKADKSSIPSKTSQLTNDSGYLTSHQSLSGYATQSWVQSQGYKTTDTNTWRGIIDSYSGTDSTISLSQKGANDLYNNLVNGYANNAGHATSAEYSTYVKGTLITLELDSSNQINFGGSDNESNIYFGYTAKGNKEIIKSFHFGKDGNGATLYCNGIMMKNSSNDYVLLGGSNHKAVSDFAMSNHTHSTATAGNASASVGVQGGSNGFMSNIDKTFIEAAKNVQVWDFATVKYTTSTASEAYLNVRKCSFAEGWYDKSYSTDTTNISLPMASDTKAGCITADFYKRVNGYKFEDNVEPGYGSGTNKDLAFSGNDAYDRIEMPYQDTDIVIYRLVYVSYSNYAIYVGYDSDGNQFKLKVENDGSYTFI